MHNYITKVYREFRNPQILLWKFRVKLPSMINLVVRKYMLRKLSFSTQSGNLMVFHIGRCGSTLLGDLLGQHPKLFWDKEVYQPIIVKAFAKSTDFNKQLTNIDPVEFLQERLSLLGRNKIYGCEVKFFHLKLFKTEISQYIAQLEQLGFNRFIILERKNYLRVIVSSLIANRTRQWHQPNFIHAKLIPIHLDVNNIQNDRTNKPLMDFLQEYEDDFRLIRKVLKDSSKVLYLTYEEHLAKDPLLAYKRIISFAGLDPYQVTVRFSKTNPFSLQDMIINFKEVKSKLLGTSFEWMLYE